MAITLVVIFNIWDIVLKTSLTTASSWNSLLLVFEVLITAVPGSSIVPNALFLHGVPGFVTQGMNLSELVFIKRGHPVKSFC